METSLHQVKLSTVCGSSNHNVAACNKLSESCHGVWNTRHLTKRLALKRRQMPGHHRGKVYQGFPAWAGLRGNGPDATWLPDHYKRGFGLWRELRENGAAIAVK